MLKLYTLLFLTTLVSAVTAKQDLIESVHFPKKNRIEIKINKEFKKAYLHDDFFVEYDEDIDLTKLDYEIVTLPFLMNVMSLIWISGKKYSIESMDQNVYDSLERIKSIFKIWYPRTHWDGELIPRKFITLDPIKPSNSVHQTALLFSGGIDSLTCSYKHRDRKQLLITAWGQSCLPLNDKTLWHEMREYLEDFAQNNGHQNAFLKSNYYYFLNFKALSKLSPDIVSWRIETVEDIGWAGLIAPILISKGIPTLHIGSSDNILHFYPAACNPYIDGNIRFAGLHFKHDQFDMTRHEKIAYLCELWKHHLVDPVEPIICQKPGGIINCGTCEKCCATLLSFLALEADPRDYGYTIEPHEASKAIQKALKSKHISSTLVWQCEYVQQSGLAHKNSLCDLSWLAGIDTKNLQPYDLQECSVIDLEKMKMLFPEISLLGPL